MSQEECPNTETNEMYLLNMFCCICMNKKYLKHLFDVDNEGVSHYTKLTSSIAEMNFKEMNDQRLICGECCVTLNIVYTFRQTCLRSKTNLITYITHLQMSSHISSTTNIKEVKPEMIFVKEERESNSANEEDSFEEKNLRRGENKERIKFPASVKEECDSEEDSSACENATVDHSDVEIEDIGNLVQQTMMEDEHYTDFNETDIRRYPLAGVVMLDTESPQDGSTSQADAGTSEETDKTYSGPYKYPKGSYSCEICNKNFVYMCHLNRHLQMHSGVRPYECEICKKSFIYNNDLAKHLRMHSADKPFQCEICQKGFIHESRLNSHMLMHTGERPHQCEICQKTFIHKNDLKKHMRLHSDERPYACDICNKSYTLNCELTRHMQMHSGGRLECVVCRKSFIYKDDYNKHLRLHTDEKPYECEVCKKTFMNKDNLIKHMRIHSGDRCYQCEICEKSFTRKSNHTKHMRIHTGEVSHDCEICEKNFSRRCELTKHMRIHSEIT